MIVSIDPEKFAGAGLAFEQVGGEGEFRLLVDGEPDAHVLVRVPIVEGQLQFYPMRSAAQRQVLAMLGELTSSIQ